MGRADDILNSLRTQGEAKTDPAPPAAQAVNPPKPEPKTDAQRPIAESLSESLEIVTAEKEKKEGNGKPKARKKTTLYIDCFPTKGGKVGLDASEYIERACASLSTPHYKLEDYGKGAGLFALALRKLIEEEPLPDAVFLSLGTTEGRDSAQVFISFADTVVRGCPR